MGFNINSDIDSCSVSIIITSYAATTTVLSRGCRGPIEFWSTLLALERCHPVEGWGPARWTNFHLLIVIDQTIAVEVGIAVGTLYGGC